MQVEDLETITYKNFILNYILIQIWIVKGFILPSIVYHSFRKRVFFFAMLWATNVFYSNVWEVYTLYCKCVDHSKCGVYLYAKPRNLFSKPGFLYNTKANINDLLGSYNLLPTKGFLPPFYIFFMYTKHINLILDRVILIYTIGHSSDVHFSIYKKAFFC